MTDRQQRRAAEQSAAEAVDRQANMRAGLAAAPAGAVPVDLAAVMAQRHAVRAVGRIVRQVCRAGRHRYGSEVRGDDLVTALHWLAGDGEPMRWAVTAAGVVYRCGVLSDLDDVDAIDRVATALREAADAARAVAGITDERVAPYPVQPCPACRRRSLQVDATLRNPAYWTVSCIREACVCTGPGCGCYQRHRMEGRRHTWSSAELAMLDWAQARHRRAHPVRSGVTGHGGWAERRGGR